MFPSLYKLKEDGPWYPWISGHITPTQFENSGKAYPARYINGCLVWGLKFTDPAKEWNVEQGWIKQ